MMVLDIAILAKIPFFSPRKGRRQNRGRFFSQYSRRELVVLAVLAVDKESLHPLLPSHKKNKRQD
jgi:hypothetical protein